MIKIIVSDLDGTLLLPGCQELQDETLDIIKKLLDKGYLFVAASGRQYMNVKRMFGRISDRISYICENGSLVVYGQKIIYKASMPENTKKEIIEDVIQHENVEVLYSASMKSYIDPKTEYFRNLIINVMKNDAQVISGFKKVMDNCIKISAYCHGGIHKDLEEYWKRKFGNDVEVVRSSGKWIDFMPTGINKGNALKFIMKKEMLTGEEGIVFGDNDNDAEMLLLLDHSYSMSTGSLLAKKCAKNIINRPEEILETLL